MEHSSRTRHLWFYINTKRVVESEKLGLKSAEYKPLSLFDFGVHISAFYLNRCPSVRDGNKYVK